MSVGPIPISEILAYTKLFPVADKEEFVLFVRQMDATYLDYQNKENQNGR